MSETDTYWFHCGTCGRLFSGELDFSDDRNCPHCDESPSPVIEAARPVQDAKLHQTPVVLEQKQRIDGRRPHRTHAGYKVFLAWFVLMAVIFGVAHVIRNRDNSPDSGEEASLSTGNQRNSIDPDRGFVDSALPACRELLRHYLAATTVDARVSLSLPHPGIRQEMESHYANNKPLVVGYDTLSLEASTLVDLPEGPTILTQWESTEGASFDAAFRQSQGEWRLDWHHFVRYSELSWPMFLAGSGEKDIAEFRLHARQRMAREDDPRNGIGVVLSAPMRRQMHVEGFSQSMMGLSLDEPDGKLLEKAFVLEAGNDPILGAEFRDINPEAMIRIRVRVQRIGGDGGNTYRITKVLACHWYESEATGLK